MNPIIKKSWELVQKLDLSINVASRHIGVADNTYSSWLRDETEPRENSLKKVQKFIDRAEAGETFGPEEKQKPKDVSIANLQERVQIMYELIYKLENKYGSLGNVDDDDPVLKLLREEAGA